RSHYAAQDWKAALRQESGNGSVRRDHEVLDEILRAIGFVGLEGAHRVAGEVGMHLGRFELEGPLFLASGSETLRSLILEVEVVRQTRDRAERSWHLPAALEPRAHTRIGELRLVAHDRAVNARGSVRAVPVDLEFD